MIELVNTSPSIDVAAAEYKRLLGYPPRHAPSRRARELMDAARRWYAAHARPWTYVRQAKSLGLSAGTVIIDGIPFTSQKLERALRDSAAEGIFLVAVSAGAEIEQEAHRAWMEGKPDEYFFLEAYGSAVVEHLTTTVGAKLCAWADGERLAVLPHASPGYSGWEMRQQAALLQLIRQPRNGELPGELDALDSGMLRPKKSLLAVFGLTRHADQTRRLTELNPCHLCSFTPCQYRRAPYVRAAIKPGLDGSHLVQAPAALDRGARYVVNRKALERWSQERLELQHRADGSIDASFRYDGTTCSNMGRPLAYRYQVWLSSPEEGYIIRSGQCEPVPGDVGHTLMCGYLENAERLTQDIAREKPLLGRPLNDVLTWQPQTGLAGCYCTAADRMHKWRIVLETIHFALVEQETKQPIHSPVETVLT